MVPVNALTLKNLRTKGDNPSALTKYAQLGILFCDRQNKTDAWYQDYFIEELARLADDLGIAPLSAFGVSTADIDNIVTKTGNKYNPTPLTREDLATILRSRITE
jgi:alcohol dehydrogenase class IV